MHVPVRCPELTDALAAGLSYCSKWMPYGLLTVQYSKCISNGGGGVGWGTPRFQAFGFLLRSRNPAVNTHASKAVFAGSRWAKHTKQSWDWETRETLSSLVGVLLFSFLLSPCCLLEGTKWVEQTCLLLLHKATTTTTTTVSLRWCEIEEVAKYLSYPWSEMLLYHHAHLLTMMSTFYKRRWTKTSWKWRETHVCLAPPRQEVALRGWRAGLFSSICQTEANPLGASPDARLSAQPRCSCGWQESFQCSLHSQGFFLSTQPLTLWEVH